MFKIFIILTFALFLAPLLSFADEPVKPKKDNPAVKSIGDEKHKLEFTQKDIDDIKAAEEKYKDNPAVLKIIDSLKKGIGIDQPEQEKEPPPPPKHISTAPGSREAAHAAYSKKDYATALEQYKALAAAGDPEASAILGMMYEGGIGTDPDPATAQAWYKRAAEMESEDNRFSTVVTDKTVESYEKNRLSGEDSAKAGELYGEINEEINTFGSAEPADKLSEKAAVETTGTMRKLNISTPEISEPSDKGQYAYMPEPRAVKITLRKIEQPQDQPPGAHTKPEHFQPEKFTRQPVIDTVIDD